MTIKELSHWGKQELQKTAVAEPEASAQFLLRHILKISRAEYLVGLEQKVSSKNERAFKKLIARRKKHEPVWQIVGAVEFWGREFLVNKNVLVPRPETEFLIEEALNRIKNYELGIQSSSETRNSRLEILDVGTGSGAIAITLAKEDSRAKVTAVDISTKALYVAKKNAKKHKAKNVKFIKSDLFKSKKLKGKRFDLITSNLPYIPTEDLGGLALDVHHHEPRLALDGGAGGLVLYEKFLKEVPPFLKKGATLFCEIGAGQGKEFKKLAKKYLPKAKCTVKKDYGSFDRIAIIET